MAGRLALLAALSALAALPAAAHATFPGTNGKIAYEGPGLSGVSSSSIFSMNPDGGAKFNLTANPAKGANRRGASTGSYDPSYSANGRKIVFERVPQGVFRPDIWVMNADGSGQVNLTNTTADDEEAPAFSPDGSKIAFIREPNNGDAQLYVMNADGTGATLLTGTAGLVSPDSPEFSPDGSKIAFDASTGSESDIFTIGANGQGLVNVTENTPAFNSEPSWSPDGLRIAFRNVAALNAESNILTIGAGGGPALDLTTSVTGASVGNPSYSPDGILIAYDRDDGSDGNSDIFTMRSSDGLAQTNITSDTASEDDHPSWGPVPVDPPPTEDTPPETTLTKSPENSEKTKAKLKFTSSEPGSTFECSLKGRGVDRDLKQFQPCNRGKVKYKSLEPGKKRFRVRAIDPAGNPDPTPAKAKWKVLPQET
jgi:Tol biopolymer transport system component